MKKYAVSKETFNYITSILADKPSHLLHDWEQWLNANSVGSESYNVIKELSHFNKNPSIVIAELLQGKAELELIQEKKYRVYHQQPTHDTRLFSYHFFDKNYNLNEDDFFTSVPKLTQEQVNDIVDIEGNWVWLWVHEVK
jgi:hypothetical protein